MIKELDDFTLVTTKIFNKLLETFPNPIDLDATVAGYEATAGYHEVATEGTTSSWAQPSIYKHPEADEQLFANTLHWLANEGYVRVEKVKNCRFSMVVLTEKGLRLLKALPPCLS